MSKSNKLWGGRFEKDTATSMTSLSKSTHFDGVLPRLIYYKQMFMFKHSIGQNLLMTMKLNK